MAVGIPEIDAGASIRPGKTALDGDVLFLESCAPCRQTRRGNAETEVRLAARAVGRNCSERQDRSLGIAATSKEQQHLGIANLEGAEALIGLHDRITKQLRVKFQRSIQVLHVQTSFHNRAREDGCWLIR
jgi:hypothetical protein